MWYMVYKIMMIKYKYCDDFDAMIYLFIYLFF